MSQQRNQEIEAFVKKVLQYKDAEHSKEKQTIAKLKKVVATAPRRLGTESEKLFGVNTHGWNVVLSGDRVLHVENRHGTDGKHDESMADLRKWEQILNTLMRLKRLMIIQI